MGEKRLGSEDVSFIMGSTRVAEEVADNGWLLDTPLSTLVVEGLQ